MRRLLPLLLILAATPLLAINTASVLRPGDRIGVLRIAEREETGAEERVARAVHADLLKELRERGFDAFDTSATYDDLRRGEAGNAPFYVEIVSASAADRDRGSVDAGVGGVWTTLSLLVSHVAAEVRLYDGRTLETVDRAELEKKRAAVVPTSIGVGGGSIFAAIALPFVQYSQTRSAAHDVARQAAERIAQMAQP